MDHQRNSNVMDYVTIASTGNTVDYGDLAVAREGLIKVVYQMELEW